MQISSRFTIAVHIFMCIDTFENDCKITSDFLASSTNVNPVIIRRIIAQLKSAGLIDVKRGRGGATITKSLDKITFLDIYNAVECIDNKLNQVQSILEYELSNITLANVQKDLKNSIVNDSNTK